MKKKFIAAGFVLFSFMLPLKASAAQFSGLYVFGDSLSDDGNVYNLVGFPPFPYSNGHFSNGPIWINELAQKLQLDSSPTLYTDVAKGVVPQNGINFAFGGATTTSANTISSLLPGLPQEIGAFQTLLNSTSQSADQNGLYILWAGANDYLPTQSKDFIPFTNPDTSLKNISDSLRTLASLGVKNVLVPNLPNLGNTPLVRSLGQSDGFNNLTKLHNDGLSQLLKKLDQDPSLGLDIISVDVNSLFSDPTKLGFTNSVEPCLNTVAQTICTNPDEYLYWDPIHPTTRAHQLLADAAFSAIKAKSVPEPSTALGTLAIGAWGAAAVLKRKRKQTLLTTAGQVPGGQSTRIKVEN
ncbi:hypothetical protein BV378_37800 [Nostoc sp. RF31YmG]|nr:hypothetical protein BV378_37800 [Nostoc sp. RF31YmG]